MSLYSSVKVEIGSRLRKKLGELGISTSVAGGLAGLAGDALGVSDSIEKIQSSVRNKADQLESQARDYLQPYIDKYGFLFNNAGFLQQTRKNSNKPLPLYGGLTPKEAVALYKEGLENPRAMANLFLIEVTSPIASGMVEKFNIFASDISYSPYTLTAQKLNVGGAKIDQLEGNEPVEINIVTNDDMSGTLKKWYAEIHNAAAKQDGTFGVPADYAVKFKIIHAYLKDIPAAYFDVGYFRAANLELALSRKDSAAQELQMSFSQIDSFYKGYA